jgi:hypothetical protein
MRTSTIAAAAAALLFTACTRQPAPQPEEATATRTLERAGQQIDPLKTASHITVARLSALAGDQDGVRRNAEAMAEDMRRAMKLADPGRRIDQEAARQALRGMQGVRSVVWLDRTHLLVRVDDVALRTHHTIDEVCYRLQPLGDTLGVVVHLQSATERNIGDLDALKRNCQLAPGDRAFAQRDRTLNALDPTIREQHFRNNERARSRPRREMSAGDRAALEAIPEM